MIIFLLKLIVVHLLGDFVLQPNSWIKKRLAKGILSKELYFHIGVHAILLILLFANDLTNYTIGFLMVIVSHSIIDLSKISCERKYPNRQSLLFLTDQLLHFIVIFAVGIYYFPLAISFERIDETKILLVVSALLAIIYVCPIIIRLFFLKWSKSLKKLNKGSLRNAGKYIGICERVLLVIFILTNFYEGIGYLLAAKSIFRFGDLTNAKEKKLTEYIVLGTFVSFILGIMIGFGLKLALHYLA